MLGVLGDVQAFTQAGELWAQRDLGMELPRIFGDYELLEEIARGGMGVVYKARQISLDRIVAVKMILGGLSTREFVQRFRSEASASASLRHPNIVAIHEVGVCEGEHFLAMDFVDGPNLAQLTAQRSVTPMEAARYLELIAKAIHYAHERNILHRDLKPANVLIDSDGQPHITDFGLAKRLEADTDLTLSGQVLGSPNYISPEQAAGKRGAIGRRSDIYSLGAILYFLLTGRAPFQGQSLTEILHSVTNNEPVAPRLLAPEVPRDLETICRKCLEKEPSRRYATAQALADDLGRFLAHEPILARRITPAARSWRWCRRKPALAAAVGSAALLLLILAIGSPTVAVRINQARADAVNNARALRRSLYVSDMNYASIAVQQRQFSRARELLERYQSPLPGEEDLRGIEWCFLWQQCQRDFDASFEGEDEMSCAVFSPDGALLATASKDGVVQIWDVKTRRRTRTLKGFDSFIDYKALAFSPDGQLLVAKGGDRLQRWRVGSWENAGTDLKVESNWTMNNAVAFSPDGETLATRVSGGVGFVNVRRWQTNDLFIPDVNRRGGSSSLGTVLQYSPDGRFLFLSDWHELVVRDAHAPLRTIASLMCKDRDVAWRILGVAMTGEYLAAGFRDGSVTFWNTNDWREINSFHAQSSVLMDLAFSPDAKHLVTCSQEEDAIHVWRVEDLLRAPVAREPLPQPTFFRGHTRGVNSVMFSPDGKTLVSSSSDRTVKLWRMSALRSEQSLPGSGRPLWFSQDGRKLLMGHTNFQVHLWDVAPLSDLGAAGHPLDARELRAISPDGDLVAVAQPNRLEVRVFQTGKRLREFEMTGSTFARASFAAASHGRRLAFAMSQSRATTFWIWEVDSEEQPRRITAGPTIKPALPFALSRDGRVLAFANVDGGFVIYHAQTDQSRFLPAGGEPIATLALSWDGALLAGAGSRNFDKVRFWETDSGRELAPLTLSGLGIAVAEFSSDGKSLITCSWDGDVTFWSMATRKELMTVPNRNLMQAFLLLSPDGSALAMPSPITWGRGGHVSVWRAPSFGEIAARQKLENQK
jgi:WD40 repeat protein/predicted Ser/Thr protein kinase